MQALIAQGDNIDAGTAQQAQAAIAGPAPINPDAAALEWMMIPEALAFVICGMFPEVAPAYTEEAKLNLARKIAPVAEKHGWNGPGDSPELMLAVGAFGFSMPAIMAYRARKALADQKPEEGKPDERTE
ncbi:hypothetical protein Hsero_2362 [Herbaspirillum seropedicae SmR1]|uniref:Uncharacterized protein n=1 Tax=Herbaspirillum seropedicae (strain SmR1) TaxID=757424 RepID=D8IVC2_HERSS|nr:hypothetical protein [Herbaspirillum seropedicae]ADJ63861.1 hypothetical protein Hsero_2362 [Herbaspirillum seropedicae SmR1]